MYFMKNSEMVPSKYSISFEYLNNLKKDFFLLKRMSSRFRKDYKIFIKMIKQKSLKQYYHF